ncbi:MAG: alpha/beta hydrolase [Pseudomonadota bacterium]
MTSSFFLRLGMTATMMAAAGAGAANEVREEPLDLVVSGVSIPCRLSWPAEAPTGAALLLPGSLYSDVDGDFPTMNMRPHAYADLAGQLAERGILVLRMAKIGPGTGAQVVDADEAGAHSTFATRRVVALAALRMLRARGGAVPTVVMGHSEGAVVASMLAGGAGGDEVDGVVSLSGPSLPIFGIMREQISTMPAAEAPDIAIFDAAIAALRAGRAPSQAAASDPRMGMLLSMPPPALVYLRSIDAVNPLVEIAGVRQPVLFVQGGRDPSVPTHHVEALSSAYRGRAATMRVFPELNHFYKRVPVGLAPMSSMQVGETSDPAVAEAIATWLSDLRAR